MNIKFKDIAIIGGSVGAGYWFGFRKGAEKMRDKILDFATDLITKSEEKQGEES